MIRIENKLTTELDKHTLEEILAGFNGVFILDRPYDVMYNQYTKNAFGYSYHVVVYDDDKVIGHSAAVPNYYYLNGKKCIFVDGVDAYMLKEYRDGIIFVDMIMSLFDFAKANGAVLLYGVPDKHAMKIFDKVKLYKKAGLMNTYILPYRVGGVKPSLRFFNFITEGFSWCYAYLSGLFAGNKEVKYAIEKDEESFNATRYQRMNGDYGIVKQDGLEFYYKVMPFRGVRAAFIVDVVGKSARHFNQAVKYLLEHERENFDVILYVGKLPFKGHGLIKVPTRIEPKKFYLIIRLFDKNNKCDAIYDINQWDMNLSNYDVI